MKASRKRKSLEYYQNHSNNNNIAVFFFLRILLILWIFFITVFFTYIARDSFVSITRLNILSTIDTALNSINTIPHRAKSTVNDLRDDHLSQVRMKSECSDYKGGLCAILDTNNLNISGQQSTSGRSIMNPKLERRPMCDFSGPRSIICELQGDIRIAGGNSSSVVLVAASTSINISESCGVRPYARKTDQNAMRKVRKVSLHGGSSSISAAVPTVLSHFTVNHRVPGIVFSTGGYVGNLFHDFSDVLIPLYLTSNQYQGEVQLLVTDLNPWFFSKYWRLLSRLSHYKVIDLDRDDRKLHCFSNLTVGLRCHKDFNIDPLMMPLGFSMVNFTRFVKESYYLERAETTSCRDFLKPRLLLLTRRWSRTFTNFPEIIEAIRRAGFEVVATELGWMASLDETGRTVNSCDVLMGVHGAGLTNQVFLPARAAVIQVVPWGQMGEAAYVDYGRPAEHSGLRYLQYDISLEESSLIGKYGRDHEYIKDPSSVNQKGWNAVRDAYLNQNVTLDLKRFEPLLLETMKHLTSICNDES